VESLRVHRRERGVESGLHFGLLCPQSVLVEGLRAGGHLRVVQAEFFLEADELEDASRHAGERAIVADRVELVLEADDGLGVVERPVGQLLAQRLEFLVHPRRELLVVDRQRLGDPRREL
jgi:hypothetical protein